MKNSECRPRVEIPVLRIVPSPPSGIAFYAASCDERVAAATGIVFNRLQLGHEAWRATAACGLALARKIRKRADQGEFRCFPLVHADLGLLDHREFWALAGLCGSRRAPSALVTFHEPRDLVLHPLRPLPAGSDLLAARALRRMLRHALGPVERAFKGRLLKRLAGTMALTQTGVESLRQWRAPSPRFIPHGTEIPEWVCEPDSRPPLIVYHGYLTRSKGVDVLLEAFASLVREKKDHGAILVIAGDTTPSLPDQGFKHKLGALVSSQGLAEKVRFEGFVTRERRDTLFKKARCLVVPYLEQRDPGAASGVLLRGIGAGVPVIASNLASLAEYLGRGSAGLLVPPGDPDALARAILALVEDPSRAQALGKRARELAVSRFGWETVAGGVADIYREALRTLPEGASLATTLP